MSERIVVEGYSGFCVDSRLVNSCNLFFALDGDRVDGHNFIGDAIQNGATGFVVRKDFDLSSLQLNDSYSVKISDLTKHSPQNTLASQNKHSPQNIPASQNKHSPQNTLASQKSKTKNSPISFYQVESPLKTLQILAKEKLANHSAKVIAVTGSVGKTTMKGFIATILAKKYRTSVSPGNYNSQIGLPLSILNHLKSDDEVIVLEMGMDRAGQIKQLVEIAPPDIALITAVELVHAVNFSSLEGIARAKEEIFSHPKTKNTIALYGASNKANTTYSVHSPKANFFYDRDKRVVMERFEGAEAFNANDNDNSQSTRKDKLIVESPCLPPLNLLGDHTVQNFLGAVTVARMLGLDWEAIISAIPDLKLPNGRLESSVIGGITILNDAYNACVPSMKGAIMAMPQPMNGGSRIALLGDMRELGHFSEEAHREVKTFAEKHIDKVYFLGAGWGDCGAKDKEEIIADLRRTLQSGDVLLLKGSRVWALENVIKEISVFLKNQAMICNDASSISKISKNKNQAMICNDASSISKISKNKNQATICNDQSCISKNKNQTTLEKV